MVCPGKEDFEREGEAEGSSRRDRALDDDVGEESGEIDRSGSSEPSDAAPGSRRISDGRTDRLRDVLRDGRDVDLLLERNDVENGVLLWLRVMDLQVMGACRADERLKPLLKLKVSSGIAEDRLIAQLSQHFEASEVALLARCLCISLVSIRVGKVNKQGNLLCPTSARGHLKLKLLPSSDMCILFCGDDGCNERLALVSHNTECSEVTIEEISADSSGRSFLLRLPGDRVSYFWCSEKSKLLGAEMLSKMKNLLQRKPSLSQLTGICESRLDSFATHLQAYLLGATNSAEANSTASSASFISSANGPAESDPSSQSSSTISRSSRLRVTVGEPAKPHPLHQGSLSPRSNTFKDGLPRNSSFLRSVSRDKLRRRGDSYSSLLTTNNPPSTTSTSCETCTPPTSHFNDDKLEGGSEEHYVLPFCLPEMTCLKSRSSSFTPLSLNLSPSRVPGLSSSLFSPYYCWCPPGTSSLQYTVTTQLPSMGSESMSLPPLSSLLSAAASSVSFVPSKPPLDLAELPTMDLPTVFPDSLVQFPLPATSFVPMPSSQQIPTFIPFMSDPIVHIPIIDVCSSGQGYLVSAGPTISSAVPPLLPSLVNPLIPDPESVAEKNARETLRMLMASTPTSPQLMKVLPVLTGVDENFSHVHTMNHGVVVAGSRGLYSGTRDINAVANGVCLMGLSLPSSSMAVSADDTERNELKIQNQDDLEDQSKMLEVSEGFCCTDEGDSSFE